MKEARLDFQIKVSVKTNHHQSQPLWLDSMIFINYQRRMK